MQRRNKKPPAKRKKSYQAPKLIVYGTIVELTQASGGMGFFDGAIGKMKGKLLKSSF